MRVVSSPSNAFCQDLFFWNPCLKVSRVFVDRHSTTTFLRPLDSFLTTRTNITSLSLTLSHKEVPPSIMTFGSNANLSSKLFLSRFYLTFKNFETFYFLTTLWSRLGCIPSVSTRRKTLLVGEGFFLALLEDLALRFSLSADSAPRCLMSDRSNRRSSSSSVKIGPVCLSTTPAWSLEFNSSSSSCGLMASMVADKPSLSWDLNLRWWITIFSNFRLAAARSTIRSSMVLAVTNL